MHARFVKFIWENEAQTIGSLYFNPDRPYYFTAGQYADITVPHTPADKRGITRTMTFASNPNDNLLSFTTRFSRTAGSTYKQTLQNLTPGTRVSITDAMGDMVLPLDAKQPLVFVAGGVGIASFVSMIRWLTEQNDSRDITLLYAVRNTDDIIFQQYFDKYAQIGTVAKVLFTTDHKADSMSWHGSIRKSRLTSTDILEHINPNSQMYISGSEHMVEQLQHELQDVHKIPQYRIVFDFFDGYASEI